MERITGKEVKEIRLSIGLTQEDLARRLDVANATVNRWERNNKTIKRRDTKAILAIAKQEGA